MTRRRARQPAAIAALTLGAVLVAAPANALSARGRVGTRLRLAASACQATGPTVVPALPSLRLHRRSAEEHPGGRPTAITVAFEHEAAKAAAEPVRRANQQPSRPAVARGTFIRRHPVLSGMIIGAAAGAAIATAAVGAEGAFVGTYSGAAAGAGLGWALSR